MASALALSTVSAPSYAWAVAYVVLASVAIHSTAVLFGASCLSKIADTGLLSVCLAVAAVFPLGCVFGPRYTDAAVLIIHCSPASPLVCAVCSHYGAVTCTVTL